MRRFRRFEYKNKGTRIARKVIVCLTDKGHTELTELTEKYILTNLSVSSVVSVWDKKGHIIET